MPYYKLRDMCEYYNEPSTAITNNDKFINPFLSNGKVKIYPTNNFDLNSYEYNNNNLYPYDTSYNNIVKSYKHFYDQVSAIKNNLVEREKELLIQTENQLQTLKNKTTTTVGPKQSSSSHRI